VRRIDFYVHRKALLYLDEHKNRHSLIKKHLINTVYVRRVRIHGSVFQRNILGNTFVNNSGSRLVFRKQTVNSVVKDFEGVFINSHVVSLSWRRVVR
jgi:hypothetical protein